MARPAAGVEIKTLAPAAPEGEPDPHMLYRPVPQIENPQQMKVKFKAYTPDEAQRLLLDADSDTEFKQRPMRDRDARRWAILMETDRFVHYLPNGPLCFDPEGVLLNGKSRLTGVTRQTKPIGFMVVNYVPRWMFKFFDQMRVRSLNDTFVMAGRMTHAQTGSTMRLAMRYEEFLHGIRPSLGWKTWAGERGDEHFDVDDFLARREDLADLYVAAEHCSRPSKLGIAALMVFRFYQQLAWPDGVDVLTDFWDGLKTGAMPPKSPSLLLRSWARDVWQDKERIQGKRELHLLLLFRYFALHAQGDKLHNLTWAHGFPMAMPYHPDGSEVAVKNVLAALAELDAVPVPSNG